MNKSLTNSLVTPRTINTVKLMSYLILAEGPGVARGKINFEEKKLKKKKIRKKKILDFF